MAKLDRALEKIKDALPELSAELTETRAEHADVKPDPAAVRQARKLDRKRRSAFEVVPDPAKQAQDDPEAQDPALVPVRPRRAKGFGPHVRYGGRVPGQTLKRTAKALDIAVRLGFHPVEFLARVAITGKIVDPDGTVHHCTVPERLDAAKSVSPYLMPKLVAQTVTGPDEGPLKVAVLDVTKILSDPSLAGAARKLALMAAQSEQSAQGTE